MSKFAKQLEAILAGTGVDESKQKNIVEQFKMVEKQRIVEDMDTVIKNANKIKEAIEQGKDIEEMYNELGEMENIVSVLY